MSTSFSNAELLKTLDSFPYAGADSDLADNERFARGVAQTIRSRLRSHRSTAGSHAAFLLHPDPPAAVEAQDTTTHYALDDGETDVTTGIWFVGPPVILGRRVDAPESFDALFPTIEGLGLGDSPAVTYRMTGNGPNLRFYPQGLSQPERVVTMTLAEDTIDLDKILELVDIVHRSTLVTPSGHQGGAKLWKNRTKHYPVRNVEVEIQAYLRTGLSVGLPLCKINPEQNLVSGRLDLEVEELDPSSQTITRYAVLELKVLRSFGSTGSPTSVPQTEKWVSEGVEQAYAYRTERAALAGALCCFDMRVNPGDDACIKKVESKALGLDIGIRSWPLYPDNKRYRAAGASAALSAGSPLTTP